MSVQLRLQRHGNRNRPFYHVVAADHRKPRDSKFIEKLGTYDPKSEPSQIAINADRLKFWYAKGAELSNTVAVLAKRQGIALEREKTAVAPKKKK
jgi:small subunit ribosomal protein S16